MSDDDTVPSAPKEPSASADGTTDDGRRYWKAAIAHLAPEKREAAWEFYLDRLESSAAADTLGKGRWIAPESVRGAWISSASTRTP